MTELKINPELEELSKEFPLTKDEYEGLYQSIKQDGCRHAIDVWNDIIVDGHNRYKICRELGVDFKINKIEFDSIDDAFIWSVDVQCNRRNSDDLSKYQMQKKKWQRIENRNKRAQVEAGGDKKSFIAKLQDNSIIPKQDGSVVPKSGQAQNQKIRNPKTEQIIAKELGIGHDKVHKLKIIDECGDKKLQDEVKAKKKSTHQAYREIKKKKELEQVKQQYKENDKQKTAVNQPKIKIMDCIEYLSELSDGSIDLLITDPPYSTDIEDINSFAKNWLTIALKKIKPTGRAYICIGAYPKEQFAYFNVLLNQDKFILDNPLIWTYRNTLGQTPKMKYNLNYQVILHLYNNKSSELNTNITKEMFSVQDINAPDGRLGNRFHTWQKPDELALRLIRHSTKENDLIIDCFACTGTFLIAGSKLNRRANGCEINKEFAKIAEERGCLIV